MPNVKQNQGQQDFDNLAAWFIKRKTQSYWNVVVHHLPLAVVSGVALLLPQIIHLQDFPSIPCTFLKWTGFPCPFCGFTRSFWAISHGEFLSAFQNCPLAYGVFLFVVALFLWNITALFSGIVLTPGSRLKPFLKPTPKVLIYISVLFLMNWGYRLIMGFK